MNLNYLSSIIFKRIENFTENRYWIIKISLLSVFISIFFSCPNLLDLWNDGFGQNESYWNLFYLQKENPFDFNIFKNLNPESHASKLVFRFSVPILSKILFLNRDAVIVLQIIIGFLFFVMFTKTNYNYSNDKVFSSLCTVSLALVYTGKIAFTETGGFFDIFSIFSIQLAIFYNKNILTFFLVLFSGFNDERGLLSIFFILIAFYLIQEKINYKNIINLLFSVLVYFVIRHLLTSNFGMHTPTSTNSGVGLEILLDNKLHFLTEIFKFLEGFWLIAFLCFLNLIYTQKYFKCMIVFIPFIVSIFLSFIVLDIDRSLAHSFLFTLVFINILCTSSFKNDLKYISLIVFLICIFAPTNPIIGAYNKYSNANWFIFQFARLFVNI